MHAISKTKIIFSLIAFAFLVNFTFAQSINTIDNLSKLNLPFPVNFSASEIKLLNSLSSSDLEKLIRVIKLVVENNLKSGQVKNIQANSFQNSTGENSNYQNTSTPASTISPTSGSTPSRQTAGQNNSNPYANNLPFSGTQASQQASLQTNQIPGGGATAAQNIDTNLADNTPNGTCPNSTGVIWVHTGIETCPDAIGPNPIMQRTLIEACQKVQKPLIARTIFRPTSCNTGAGDSNHTRGTAIDMYLRRANIGSNLSEKEAIIVLQTFKKNGFTGYGCYPNSGPNYVHLSISNTERYGSSCPPELKLSGYAN